MKPNGIITLLTDFGEQDGFIGVIKGVIYGINPAARIVDITHYITPQDIEAGAFILNNSYQYFPKGTVHLAVVDPGVGTDRRVLAVQTDNYFFVAPDNHILKYIFHECETFTVVDVLNKKYFLDEISTTFHGRDIFSPVAAHLSNGIALDELGERITDFDRGEVIEPMQSDNKLIGRIIYIDRFGNLITNINQSQIIKHEISVHIGANTIDKLSNFYSEVEHGKPVAVIGSSGYLEIAVRNGNAQKQLGVNRSDVVELLFS